jgi:hypothetical protein
MLVIDITGSSDLHIASCYEDGEDSNSDKIMKRPLIIATQSSSASSSLEAEEQQTRLEGKVGLVWQAFLRGSAVGFVLQFLIFATCYTIFKIWAQNPTFSGPLSLVSFFIGICLTSLYARTKSGSLHRCKKLDKHVNTPVDSNSISTARMLFVMEIYFLVGCIVGSYSLWAVVDLRAGMAVPLTPLLMTAVDHLVYFCIMVKYLGRNSGEEQEEEKEDDSFVYLLFGVIDGRNFSWIVFDVGMALLPLTRLLMTAMIYLAYFWIMSKCFDWGRNTRGGEEEEEETEEDDLFLYA